MKIYTCVIIDDELPARKLLARYAKKVPFLEIVDSFKGPLSASPLLQNQNIDIVFLDIQMNEMSGIDYLKTINLKSKVILTTAFEKYAIEGYQLDVVDYLLKPFSFERFIKAVNRAISLVEKNIDSDSTKKMQKSRVGGREPNYITIQSNHKFINIKYSEIEYIEGLGEYLSYNLIDKTKIVSLETLKNLETILPDDFVRVHKSYIVSKYKVKELVGNSLKLINKEIPIGRSYKKIIMQQLFPRFGKE
ncbi:MAG: LytTR family DNA-binding domain-containing protein [Marinifilaceae bacterium]|jgi:DNA-binding LytR/AlgR family response regulator|nr:LytTR family DNA-binding domain-containing protein [Marinifilaceae bacterium]